MREMESKSRITHVEVQLKDWWQVATLENDNLHQKLSELQEKFRGAETDRVCFERSYKEKEKENMDLQKIVARLQRTRSEQDKTISGLRQGLSEDIGNKESSVNYDNQTVKLQVELVRLTGVEQNLRKELESCRVEVDSLRRENINLLSRLQDSGNDSGFASFKLDQELQARVENLQKQGLSLFDEGSHLCTKLLESIKRNIGQNSESISGANYFEELKMNGIDRYFVVESDMRVQNFKREIENVKRSLNLVSQVLHEKSKPAVVESNSHCTDASRSRKQNGEATDDQIGLKLKAEAPLTSVLRENLLSKQLELEQLQAELATAVRGHDILRCEVQGALDTLSRVSHKMKNLELQLQ